MTQNVTVQLFDPAHDRPLHAWTFENSDQITIGRQDGNDIVLADPYVSRNHARIEFVEGQWLVRTLSDQKLYSGGHPHDVLELHHGVKFQLGPRGCTIRFECVEEQQSPMATLKLDLEATPMFQLDAEKLQQEVTKIATGDYFQKLQELARELRGHQSHGETPQNAPPK